MLELNKIYNEDFIVNKLPDNSIDLCITDPPYKLTSGGSKDTKMNGGISRRNNKLNQEGKVFLHNDIKTKDWFPEIYRILKEGTHFYCMCNDKHLKEVLEEGEKAGFKEVNVLVWEKGMHTPTQYYMKNIEFVVLFRKGKARYINNMGSYALLKFQGIRGKKHPSEKPIDLFKHFIINSSNEGDIIIDPFMGSGTTAIACINTNRNYIGFELDNTYFELASERVNKCLDEASGVFVS